MIGAGYCILTKKLQKGKELVRFMTLISYNLFLTFTDASFEGMRKNYDVVIHSSFETVFMGEPEILIDIVQRFIKFINSILLIN